MGPLTVCSLAKDSRKRWEDLRPEALEQYALKPQGALELPGIRPEALGASKSAVSKAINMVFLHKQRAIKREEDLRHGMMLSGKTLSGPEGGAFCQRCDATCRVLSRQRLSRQEVIMPVGSQARGPPGQSALLQRRGPAKRNANTKRSCGVPNGFKLKSPPPPLTCV